MFEKSYLHNKSFNTTKLRKKEPAETKTIPGNLTNYKATPFISPEKKIPKKINCTLPIARVGSTLLLFKELSLV